jgi:hypothetical protein
MRHRHRAIAALALFLTAMLAASAAMASWLDDRNASVCNQHGGALYAIMEQRIATDMATCTANCFKYILPCRDGKSFALTSRYSLIANDDDIFFVDSSVGPFVKLLLVGALGFFAFAATFGSREDNIRTVAVQNAIVFALLTLSIWVWGIRATRDGFAMGALVDFPLIIKVLGTIIFVAIRFPSFIRGCNYLLVRHPAASFVSTRGAADIGQLADTLAAGARDAGVQPTYHYEHQTQKARSMIDALDADSKVLEARADRERRRAELAEAERLLTEAQRRSEGKP